MTTGQMPAATPAGGAPSAPRPGVATAPLLHLRGLSKTFGGTKALDGVDLSVTPGEVHALLGENGSGKSTLIKVLAGFHTPDPGATLTIAGEQVPLPVPPGRFREHGVAFVHQDLALIPDLTVVENLRVADVVAGRRLWVDWRAERRRAAEVFARFGLALDPAATVAALSATERALLAIVRATEELRSAGTPGRLLVLDEPTVFLPREGADLLFGIVRDLVADGSTSVLFVSHDLDEVLEHTDRVTVLRDGRVSATVPTATIDRPGLVELIVGRALTTGRTSATTPGKAAADDEPGTRRERRPRLADVQRLRTGSTELELEVGQGEVLGLTGLAGSGYEDVLPALYGAAPDAARGVMELPAGRLDLDRLTPAQALAHGVVFIPADRAKDASIGELTVLDNVMLPALARYRSALGVKTRAVLARARELADDYDVRPREPRAVYASLSGGNQQKAVLAKWLQTEPTLVLLHEPTQGVDVGARAYIFRILADAAARGAGVIVASSDYEQLATICDRVLVLARGRVVEELSGAEVTKDRITDSVLSSMTLVGATSSDRPASSAPSSEVLP